MVFKHELGKKAKAVVTGLEGVITMRGECLFGCNRYYLQPPAVDGKVPDGWWTDEDDIVVTGDGVVRQERNTGGPMSKRC